MALTCPESKTDLDSSSILNFFISIIKQLSTSVSNKRTKRWLLLIIVAIIARNDFFGVTSFIRALFLDPKEYACILNFFYSTAWNIEAVLYSWSCICLSSRYCEAVNDRLVLIGDHVHVTKEGTKIPHVISMRDDSETSSKPSYSRGHVWLFLGILIKWKNVRFCIPLKGKIDQSNEDESLNTDNHSMTTRIVENAIGIAQKQGRDVYLILDAFFSTGPVFHAAYHAVSKISDQPCIHIVTRAKVNYVAFEEPSAEPEKGKRGRKSKYGIKVKLKEVFEDYKDKFKSGKILSGGKEKDVLYYSMELIWKPIERKLLFIWAISEKGNLVLMCSDVGLDPLKVIEMYSARSYIELFFKNLKHLYGAFCYHFWSKYLKAKKRQPTKNKKEYPESNQIKSKIEKKTEAIERFTNLCSISLGICQLISLHFAHTISKQNKYWRRTISTIIPSPFISKLVLSEILREHFRKVNIHTTFEKLITVKGLKNFNNESDGSQCGVSPDEKEEKPLKNNINSYLKCEGLKILKSCVSELIKFLF